jgi:hypothetical protein
MSEPISAALGVKLSTTVAGFAGGIVSLAFLKNLTRLQAVVAVVTGSLCAAYLTPVAVLKLGVSPDLQNAAAFVIGLCSMNIVPAIKMGFAAWVDGIANRRSVGAKPGDPVQ